MAGHGRGARGQPIAWTWCRARPATRRGRRAPPPPRRRRGWPPSGTRPPCRSAGSRPRWRAGRHPSPSTDRSRRTGTKPCPCRPAASACRSSEPPPASSPSWSWDRTDREKLKIRLDSQLIWPYIGTLGLISATHRVTATARTTQVLHIFFLGKWKENIWVLFVDGTR